MKVWVSDEFSGQKNRVGSAELLLCVWLIPSNIKFEKICKSKPREVNKCSTEITEKETREPDEADK